MELTPEQEAEYAARSKEYSRRVMREHHIWQSDLATKLRLKKVRLFEVPASSATACSRWQNLEMLFLMRFERCMSLPGRPGGYCILMGRTRRCCPLWW